MTCAHSHPCDLRDHNKDNEKERRQTGTATAASAWNLEQFLYHEALAASARDEGYPALFSCFGIHPQLAPQESGPFLEAGLLLLDCLAASGRLHAVGEAGFDLYDENLRSSEKTQDYLFAAQLKTALRYNLPLVLHVRRSLHKIFPFANDLKKLPAVVFHSWPGTRGEGQALLRRGINAYFSFGAAVLNNHKEAIASAAVFPAERLLLETDAPWQPPRGKQFSSWNDLAAITHRVASLRRDSGSIPHKSEELNLIISENFYRVFSR